MGNTAFDGKFVLLETIKGLRNWIQRNNETGTIPDYMLEPVANYLLFGILPHPGDFLEAVICDMPFSVVVPLADDKNARALPTWHRLLYNVFPSPAWRSREAMLKWYADNGTGGEPLPYLKRYL